MISTTKIASTPKDSKIKLFKTVTFVIFVIGVTTFNYAIWKKSSLSQNIESCPINKLGIELLPTNIQNSKTIIQLIKKNCYLASTAFEDFTHDGRKDILLTGIGYGCVSCHARDIYILNNNKIIFSYTGDDANIKQIPDGFLLTEPIRKTEEPYCCPSQSISTEYDYSPQTNSFIKTQSIIIDN